MKIQYDSEADALYIQLRKAKPHHVVDLPGVSGFSVDVDRAGKLVGIEILRASQALGEELRRVTFEDLALTAGASQRITPRASAGVSPGVLH